MAVANSVPTEYPSVTGPVTLEKVTALNCDNHIKLTDTTSDQNVQFVTLKQVVLTVT
jgi:hypothetical protein